jgi:tetratricopeptide (TPR) repeat protein
MEALTHLSAAEAMDDPTAAIAILESLVAAHPTMVDAQISLAFQRAASGDLSGAYADTLGVLKRWPQNPTALFNGAFLALQLGEEERALQLAGQMIDINAMDPRGYRLQAAVWTQRESPQEVLEVTQAGLKIAPEDPNLLYLSGMASKLLDQPLGAIPLLEKATRFGSKADDIPLQIAHAYELAGLIDEASQAYQNAAKKMPDDPRPRAMGGLMLAEADRCDEARELLYPLVPHKLRLEMRLQNAMEHCGL